MAATTPIPKPKIERAWHFRLFCPACRWTRDYVGSQARRRAVELYEIHYLEQHENGRKGPCSVCDGTLTNQRTGELCPRCSEP